jgi:phage tail-like protein
MTAPYDDHHSQVGFRFGFEIDGVNLAEFKEVSPITIEQALIEQKVTTGKGQVETRKYPGKAKYGDITLKRGLTADDELYRWIQQVSDGEYEKALKNGSIVQFAEFKGSLEETNRWNFEGGWPAKWELSGHKAGSNDMSVESVTIKVDRIWRG